MARLDDDKLQQILNALVEVQTDVNALRAEFLRHDHGAGDTYASATIKFYTGANSVITASASPSTTLANVFPTLVKDVYLK